MTPPHETLQTKDKKRVILTLLNHLYKYIVSDPTPTTLQNPKLENLPVLTVQTQHEHEPEDANSDEHVNESSNAAEVENEDEEENEEENEDDEEMEHANDSQSESELSECRLLRLTPHHVDRWNIQQFKQVFSIISTREDGYCMFDAVFQDKFERYHKRLTRALRLFTPEGWTSTHILRFQRQEDISNPRPDLNAIHAMSAVLRRPILVYAATKSPDFKIVQASMVFTCAMQPEIFDVMNMNPRSAMRFSLEKKKPIPILLTMSNKSDDGHYVGLRLRPRNED